MTSSVTYTPPPHQQRVLLGVRFTSYKTSVSINTKSTMASSIHVTDWSHPTMHCNLFSGNLPGWTSCQLRQIISGEPHNEVVGGNVSCWSTDWIGMQHACHQTGPTTSGEYLIGCAIQTKYLRSVTYSVTHTPSRSQ